MTHNPQVTVHYIPPPPNWKSLGGVPEAEDDYPVKEDDGCSYWYKMMYTSDFGRFEDVSKDTLASVSVSV